MSIIGTRPPLISETSLYELHHILVFSDFFKVVSFKCIDKKILKMILKYSIPLVPNSLMWWIMAAGDKYIINYFLGDSANGIYSLALKIPQIINMVYSLFIQTNV